LKLPNNATKPVHREPEQGERGKTGLFLPDFMVNELTRWAAGRSR